MNRSAEDDMAYIRSVAEILEKSGLAEISVRRVFGEGGKLSVRLSRYAAPPLAPAYPAAATAPAVAAEVSAPAPGPVEDGFTVTSPMVGTAYLAPEPGADPFVAPGTAVSEGQTLLIVEAMKTMNPIPAPRSGSIERVLVRDGEPVEYGTPLVILH